MRLSTLYMMLTGKSQVKTGVKPTVAMPASTQARDKQHKNVYSHRQKTQ